MEGVEQAIALLQSLKLSDEQIATMAQANQLLSESVAKMKMTNRNIVDHGLPALNNVGHGSTSSASESNRHGEAFFVQKPFELSEITYDKQDLDSIWSTFNSSGKAADLTLNYSTESDIKTYVASVIRDVIYAAGLSGHVSTYQEIGVGTKDKPDVWIVIKLNGVPIGVAEVKKPGRIVMESEKVGGQIYNYMMRLRSFYGIRHVFGIVTTYEEWRIVWLPDTDERATEKIIIPQEKTKTPIEAIKTSTEEPIYHGTQALKFNDSTLVQTLCTAVWKMYLSPARPPARIQVDRTYLVMSESTWVWKQAFTNREKQAKFKSTEYSMAFLAREKGPNSFRKIILLEELHGGSNGRVWLGCAWNGQSCVIKFLLDGTAQDLEMEAKNWNDGNIAQVKVIVLNKQPALIMPYYKPCGDYEKVEIQTAIVKFAESGFLHNDLHWRHVARTSKDEIIFIDRGNIKRIDPTDQTQVKGAIKKMNQSLSL